MIQYLTKSLKSVKIDKNLLEDLSKDVVLSEEDNRIFAHIREEVANHGKLPFRWTPQEDNFLNSNPKNQWLPYLIYRYKFKQYPVEKKVAAFPVYVIIEPTSICNLRCTMCFQSDATFTKKENMGMMDLDLYRNLIDQASEGGTRAITFASRGEPMLHKNIGEMLRYASGKFFDLKLNTNATKLTEKLCHDILTSGVNELVFSVDAADKALFEEIRVRANFDEIVANIKRFHDIRKKHYPDSKLTTRVSAVMFRKEQDTEKIRHFWSQICDQVVVKVVFAQRWDTYHNQQQMDLDQPCNYLWERMYIWYDGLVNPCDADYKSSLAVGNVRQATIADIWHSPAYQQLREAHLNGKRTTFMPCDRCGIQF